MTSPDKQAQMAVEGRGLLSEDCDRLLRALIGERDGAVQIGTAWRDPGGERWRVIAIHGDAERTTHLASCDHANSFNRLPAYLIAEQFDRIERAPEAFGYQSPAEEHDYGTADLAGWGDIEYPADVQPPEEAA